jgi:hypothetical protein
LHHCRPNECTSSSTPLRKCRGTCVDLRFDPLNCGACGNRCPPSAPDCCASRNNPSLGTCVDKRTDVFNCGGCGNRCPSGYTCVDGNCQCPNDTTPCGTTCCPAGQPCINGTCGCPSGTTLCGGNCVSTSCPSGQVFDPSTCQCVSGACGDRRGQPCGTSPTGTTCFWYDATVGFTSEGAEQFSCTCGRTEEAFVGQYGPCSSSYTCREGYHCLHSSSSVPFRCMPDCGTPL